MKPERPIFSELKVFLRSRETGKELFRCRKKELRRERNKQARILRKRLE